MGTVTVWDGRANLLDRNGLSGANKSSSSPSSPEWQARARAEGRTFCGWHREPAGTGPTAGFSWRQSWCWGSPCSVALRKGEEHLVFRRSWFMQMGFIACSSRTDRERCSAWDGGSAFSLGAGRATVWERSVSSLGLRAACMDSKPGVGWCRSTWAGSASALERCRSL